jgi:NAD(P)-dependent dehydrogenase (short-subunit alcohol dehydrogenase family)
MINPKDMSGARAIATGSGKDNACDVVTPIEVARSDRFRETHLSKIRRQTFLTPEDAAYSIGFILSGALRHITGQHLAVNGGSFMSA